MAIAILTHHPIEFQTLNILRSAYSLTVCFAISDPTEWRPILIKIYDIF